MTWTTVHILLMLSLHFLVDYLFMVTMHTDVWLKMVSDIYCVLYLQ